MPDRAPPAEIPNPRRIVRPFSLADRGMAMAHIDGKVAFVPFAAPGDEVEVEIVREKRRHVITRLVRVITPSPLRRAPRCPHFGRCGGCQWQHLPYPEQLRAKDRSFRGFLRTRLGLRDEAPFRDPIPSPREWGYRNRVGWKVRFFGGGVHVGYFKAGTHRLVPIRACPVARPEIEGVLGPLGEFLQGFAPARGALPQVDVQVDGRGGLWAVAHLLRPLSRDDDARLRAFFRSAGVRGAFVQAGRKHTLRPLGEDPGAMEFTVTAAGRALGLAVRPGGFVQANPDVNQAIVDEVVALADRYRGLTVLDLYAGAGNFSLPLALAARRVVAVEGYPPAARDGAANARRNGLDNVEVRAQPVARALEDMVRAGEHPGFVVMDPPREGAPEALSGLLALRPAHVLYVSCSPQTLARDLRHLTRDAYRVAWVRSADMFPQTAHMESLTLLEAL